MTPRGVRSSGRAWQLAQQQPQPAPTVRVGRVEQIDSRRSDQVEHLLQLRVAALVIVPQQLVALQGKSREKATGGHGRLAPGQAAAALVGQEPRPPCRSEPERLVGGISCTLQV